MGDAVTDSQSHIELVLFIYGTAFIVLAVILGAFRRPLGAGGGALERIDLRPLAGFALVHGLGEWIVTIAHLAGRPDLHWVIRFVEQLIANVLLFEFGRRVVATQHVRRADLSRPFAPLGYWPYALVGLGLGAFLILDPQPLLGATIWLRYSLVLPGAGLAAAGLCAAASGIETGAHSRTSLRFAAGAMVLYALTAGLITQKAAFFPAAWVNGDVFLAATYTPIELARALVVLILAAAFARSLIGSRQILRRELERINRRRRQILEATGEGIIELDRRGHIQYANPAALHILSATEGTLSREPVAGIVADAGAAERIAAVAAGGEQPCADRARLRGRDGTELPVDYICTPIRDQEETGAVLSFRDLRERESLLAMLAETQAIGRIGGWSLDVRTKKSFWSDEVFRIHEMPVEPEVDLERAIAFYHPESRPVIEKAVEQACRTGEGWDLELKFVSARGRKLWVRAIGRAHRVDGEIVRLAGTFQDITERKTTELALRDATDFYELILDSVPVRIAYVNSDERIVYVNRGYEEWFQVPRSAILNKRIRDITAPESFAQIEPRLKRVLAGEKVTFTANIRREGQMCELEVSYLPHLSRAGELLGFFSVVHDLTEQKELEAKLVQAQKMEAVGQLTGGVAHDFNNLLSVILGNLQLLERPLRDDPKKHKKIKTAMRAAMRGADLTRRLLAFARRQQLDPVVLSLNALMLNLDDLLRRTLGESVEVTTVFARDLWQVKIDPGQMENAVLNLAINARDAMAEGGQLTIETANVVIDEDYVSKHPGTTPGDYVVVAVSDTGCGMAPEVLQQVFEPFFTTKEVGKGSGLGLSMVYGFAEQSGGHTSIYSEVGHGTTVKLYLPRASADVPARMDETGSMRFMPGGEETILVVEDEADVRETVVALLTELGYRVLEASNGQGALELVGRHGEIDLLFTDVMMPGGMHGPALAEKALELRPDLRVLFTSGYTESAIMHRGMLAGSAELIAKPYKNSELALKIRTLLDKEAVHG